MHFLCFLVRGLQGNVILGGLSLRQHNFSGESRVRANVVGRRSSLLKVALLHAMGAAVLQPGASCTRVQVREFVLKSEALGFLPFII